MKSAEILEWVMGWPWPVIIAFVVVIAGGIERLVSWYTQDISEEHSSGSNPGKECECQCG